MLLENNQFELNGQQIFSIGEDNYLTYIATSVWYQAIQYNDPFNNFSEIITFAIALYKGISVPIFI